MSAATGDHLARPLCRALPAFCVLQRVLLLGRRSAAHRMGNREWRHGGARSSLVGAASAGPVQEVHSGSFSCLKVARLAPSSAAGTLLPSLSIVISALILATTGSPMLRRSMARSRGRGAPRADRGGRSRRRHLLWPAAAAGCGGVCTCTSGSPSLFWAAGSRVGRWSSTGRSPPITSRRARVFGEDTRAPLLAHRVGRLAGCKGKSQPCVLAAAGTAVCRPPAPEDAAMGSVGTEAAAGGRR